MVLRARYVRAALAAVAIAAGGATVVLGAPLPGLGRVRVAVVKSDVVQVAVPVNTAGKLTALATYGNPERHYVAEVAMARAGTTYHLTLRPPANVRRVLARRGRLTVSITVTLRESSQGKTETTPRLVVLRRA